MGHRWVENVKGQGLVSTPEVTRIPTALLLGHFQFDLNTNKNSKYRSIYNIATWKIKTSCSLDSSGNMVQFFKYAHVLILIYLILCLYQPFFVALCLVDGLTNMGK